MNNISFVHTFWTKPALNDRWNVNKIDQIIKNIWYYTLSTVYIKRLYHNIELHTDDFGMKCLDHIPYDKIHLTLNSIPNYIKPYSWAFGKFWALQYCPLNSAHIDGDVFVKSIKCLDKIYGYINEGYDGVFQNTEHGCTPNYPIYGDTVKLLSTLRYPVWGDRFGVTAYNTGFLLFNNQNYKEDFLSEYFRCHKDCGSNKVIAQQCELNRHECPDLIIEQQFMYDLAQHKKLKIGTLLQFNNMHNDANGIGYQHIIGKQKYDDYNIKNCTQTLLRLDRELYIKTLNKCRQIHNYLSGLNQ